MSYYNAPLKIRYQHRGQHRPVFDADEHRQNIIQKIFITFLLVIALDIGVFIVLSTLDKELTPVSTNVVTPHQTPTPELIPSTVKR